jgi:hypothetical protein
MRESNVVAMVTPLRRRPSLLHINELVDFNRDFMQRRTSFVVLRLQLTFGSMISIIVSVIAQGSDFVQRKIAH